jgi:hypothetical protein
MPNLIIKISQQEFDSMRLMNNNVAIEITHRNAEEKTKSGIIIVQDPKMLTAHSVETAEMHDSSQHLDRWGIVAKLPSKLKFAQNSKTQGMDWDTDIEIQVGDLVWSDYYNLHHCPIFQVEEKQYWIVTYDCLIVAKRPYNWRKDSRFGFSTPTKESFDGKNGISWQELDEVGSSIPEWRKDKIIPLNGYCLFNQINEGLTSKFLILDEKINKTKGITRFAGSRNREYTQQWSKGYGRFIPSKKYDDIDIKPGDEVLFRTEANCLLENAQHRYFADEDLRYEQRWNIIGIKTN